MLKLAMVFTDGAVLQRGKTIPVWGWSDSTVKISAELNGQKAFCYSALTGNFLLRLPKMEAGGPYVLTVRNEKTGEEVKVNDILIGEVWICSGQSNMQYPLGGQWSNDSELDNKRREANLPLLYEEQKNEFFAEKILKENRFRFFGMPMSCTGAEELDCDHRVRWQSLSTQYAEDCTAVGAWFGLKLLKELQVPVGLLFTAYGGTDIEAWVSESSLAMNPYMSGAIPRLDAVYADSASPDRSAVMGDSISFKDSIPDSGNEGVGWGWAEPDFNDADWKDFVVPGSWIEQKIAKNGAVWARRTITIPDDWKDCELMLHLGGIDKTDITYFNGVEVGHTGEGDFDTMSWNKLRCYKIPARLVKPGRAVIAVRMYSFCFDGSMNRSANIYQLRNDRAEEEIPLAGTWKAMAERETGDFSPYSSSTSYGRGNANTPGILFNTMIRPLVPYANRGVIWYQGENNACNFGATYGYASKMKCLLDDWRRAFRDPDMPLIQVELAGYNQPQKYFACEAWTSLRDEQHRACEMKGLYLISATDVGEADDIHPQDKKTPGERLAACALNKVYGWTDVVPNGPELTGYDIDGNSIILHFSCAEGLEFRGNPLDSFYVANASYIFVPADEVVIRGRDVIVTSRKYDLVMAVRYAWADNPTMTLYNGAGYPASPFRTDSWNLFG